MSDDKAIAQKHDVEYILSAGNVKKRFEDMLKEKAPGFISSVLSVWKNDSHLQKCESWSVVSAAAIAASLDLPINPSLGLAALVPYSGVAQFQMMWKGYVQLAERTGQYKSINASNVYDDEIASWNPITGEFIPKPVAEWKNRYQEDGKGAHVAGYVAYIKMLNGFEKYLYMTKAECLAHGKKYSQTFRAGKGRWMDNPEAMSLKTVVKLLLSKWGLLSVDLQKAVTYDQATIKPSGEITYLDNPQIEEKDPTEADGPIPTPGAVGEAKQVDAPAPGPTPSVEVSKLPIIVTKLVTQCGICKDKIEKGTKAFHDKDGGRSFHAPSCPGSAQ